VVYISGQVFIPIEINILTMLLTYQIRSFQHIQRIAHYYIRIAHYYIQRISI